MGSPPLLPADYATHKRKRSHSPSTVSTPPTKTPKTTSAHLQINYLARQFPEILPLISTEDPLPSLLTLISDYDSVLQRHESMAGNLGARPLGPILIQRFERLFDGPPRVLKTHGKEGTTVGWLDVVEFARNKPEQFNLDKMRDSVRVCQFYTKQCRVEINEDDYHLVKSGMPQNMIPPQPIAGDEEKELGTLEILEGRLGNVVQLADQVSARARQLNHRLRNRRNAIVQRREAEAAGTADEGKSPAHRVTESSAPPRSHANGYIDRASNSPTGGFVAVNSRQPAPPERSHTPATTQTSASSLPNGTQHGASAATRAELLSKFTTKIAHMPGAEPTQRRARRDSNPPARPFPPTSTSKPNSKPFTDSMEYANLLLNNASPQSTVPVAIPNTPSSLLPYVKPSPADRFEDSGPYKADMMARMEQLNRGDRVQPPCDRCRRLHMDCLKNLTACMGCTKKHAKCSWKDVEAQELKDHPFVPRTKPAPVEEMDTGSDADGNRSMDGRRSTSEASREVQGVRDEELLGEESEEDEPRKGKLPEGHYNARSRSGSKAAMSREPVPDDLEKLPPPVRPSPPKDATFAPVNRQEGQDSQYPTTEASQKPYDTTLPMAMYQARKASYQAPQARMTSHKDETNGANGHVQTQYEKDIYTQLHEATRESTERERHSEPVKVYTAGSEPAYTETSPVQPIEERRLPSPPPHPWRVEERRLPSPSPHLQRIQERQVPSPQIHAIRENHTPQRQHTPARTERAPSPPQRIEELQLPKIRSPPRESQPLYCQQAPSQNVREGMMHSEPLQVEALQSQSMQSQPTQDHTMQDKQAQSEPPKIQTNGDEPSATSEVHENTVPIGSLTSQTMQT